MNRLIVVVAVAIGVASLPTYAQQQATQCAIKFSLAEKDTLGNLNVGFSPDGQKWFDQKVGKRYPNVCYSDQQINAGIWLYILDSTQTQGSTTATTRAMPDGTTDTTISPNRISQLVYTLKIINHHDGNTDVLRIFQCPSPDRRACRISGKVAAIIHPERAVILDAIDWLSKADLAALQPN